jgi:hypothetical protein
MCCWVVLDPAEALLAVPLRSVNATCTALQCPTLPVLETGTETLVGCTLGWQGLGRITVNLLQHVSAGTTQCGLMGKHPYLVEATPYQ